jgi:hypothetical protein
MVTSRIGFLKAGREPEHEVLFNVQPVARPTRCCGTRDALGGMGVTLVCGRHSQEQNDVNGDTWADLPCYSRAVIVSRRHHQAASSRRFRMHTGCLPIFSRLVGSIGGPRKREIRPSSYEFIVAALQRSRRIVRTMILTRNSW